MVTTGSRHASLAGVQRVDVDPSAESTAARWSRERSGSRLSGGRAAGRPIERGHVHVAISRVLRALLRIRSRRGGTPQGRWPARESSETRRIYRRGKPGFSVIRPKRGGSVVIPLRLCTFSSLARGGQLRREIACSALEALLSGTSARAGVDPAALLRSSRRDEPASLRCSGSSLRPRLRRRASMRSPTGPASTRTRPLGRLRCGALDRVGRRVGRRASAWSWRRVDVGPATGPPGADRPDRRYGSALRASAKPLVRGSRYAAPVTLRGSGLLACPTSQP